MKFMALTREQAAKMCEHIKDAPADAGKVCSSYDKLEDKFVLVDMQDPRPGHGNDRLVGVLHCHRTDGLAWHINNVLKKEEG